MWDNYPFFFFEKQTHTHTQGRGKGVLTQSVIPQFCFYDYHRTLSFFFNIKLRYYMCVHTKMGVDNLVVLQIGEKIKVLVHTIWCGN